MQRIDARTVELTPKEACIESALHSNFLDEGWGLTQAVAYLHDAVGVKNGREVVDPEFWKYLLGEAA